MPLHLCLRMQADYVPVQLRLWLAASVTVIAASNTTLSRGSQNARTKLARKALTEQLGRYHHLSRENICIQDKRALRALHQRSDHSA